MLFVVSIMALTVGTLARSAEQGAAELLFSQPVRRSLLL
jgi:hypothetical protein